MKMLLAAMRARFPVKYELVRLSIPWRYPCASCELLVLGSREVFATPADVLRHKGERLTECPVAPLLLSKASHGASRKAQLLAFDSTAELSWPRLVCPRNAMETQCADGSQLRLPFSLDGSLDSQHGVACQPYEGSSRVGGSGAK